ncbi:MAG: hypothetical protein KDA25_07120, partial [Phycisphaerales bacterium]|nr:hypothetical protein [Phycisphaerales bacterium]
DKTVPTPQVDPAPPGDQAARPTLLFTAFEPSGDALAAPVIAALRKELPGVRIFAWGGPKMEAAGAELIENTAADGAMGLGALSHVLATRREQRRIRRWSSQFRVIAHVAVDAPAANFPICAFMRKSGARIVHLNAPQLWAWGRWRTNKLRRLTDLVLCVLPFEEQWFGERTIPAKFIGHPAINRELDMKALKERMHGLPAGAPRLGIFPGSRTQEVRRNIRLLISIYAELQARHSGMAGVICAANGDIARLIRKKVRVFPTGLHMTTAEVDATIAWSDLCVAVSGTVTLNIARHCKPMIGVYKTGVISWLLSKVLLRTPYCLLPNIIADREICPEFIPHIGGSDSIVSLASRYLQDSKHAAIQNEALRHVCIRFANKRPAEDAAALILRLVQDGKVPLR